MVYQIDNNGWKTPSVYVLLEISTILKCALSHVDISIYFRRKDDAETLFINILGPLDSRANYNILYHSYLTV